MSEKGSDELLLEIDPSYDPADAVLADFAFSEQEERRVASTPPAKREPGRQHPDPDETPPGDPPDYDPMPPEEAP